MPPSISPTPPYHDRTVRYFPVFVASTALFCRYFSWFIARQSYTTNAHGRRGLVTSAHASSDRALNNTPSRRSSSAISSSNATRAP